MRTSRHHKTAFAIALALLAQGCPETNPAPPHIARVELVGDARTTDFSLHITGNGFGLNNVTYDLSSQSGSVRPSISLQIFDGNLVNVNVGSEDLTITSPKSIEARVLGHALPPGSYGVRMFADGNPKPIASAADMFIVEGEGADLDGGVQLDDSGNVVITDAGDGGVVTHDDAQPGRDADLDATPLDGTPPLDATPIDTDTGVAPDSGVPPDSGLGVFEGAYAFRQEVIVDNTTVATVPSGTTVRIPIPHASLLGVLRAKADASDIALYYGATRLDHQWDDATKIGTDQLIMIARLPEDAALGRFMGASPLVLYYGDANVTLATDENVFQYAQRFDNNLPNSWVLNNWFRCNFARPTEAQVPSGQASAFCIQDDNDNPTRRTLGSPNLGTLSNNLPANLAYEVSVWIAGQMENQANDGMYFAYGPDPDTFANTTQLLNANNEWDEFPQNVPALSFTETTNQTRTVEAWRLPAGATQWWTRARGHFSPNVDNPSIHFRFISADGNDNTATVVIIDDLTFRLRAIPELGVTLGPVDVR